MTQPPGPPTRAPAHLPVLTEVLDDQPAVQPVVRGTVFNHVPPKPGNAIPQPEALPDVDLSFPPAIASRSKPDSNVNRATPSAPSSLNAVNVEKLSQHLRANLRLQMDQLIEAKLREVMTAHMAQQVDTLVFRLKLDLSAMLDDMVTRAVAQEIQRQITPDPRLP